MGLRHLIIAAMLASFAPAALPLATIGKVEAAQTVKKKKKKVVVQQKQQPRVKTNFRGPRPGEPDAGWTSELHPLLRSLWQDADLLRQIWPRLPDVGLVAPLTLPPIRTSLGPRARAVEFT